MKKASLIILCVILLGGCTVSQLQPNQTAGTTPASNIPFSMDFKDFKVTLTDYSVTETLDSTGYTTVIDLKLEFDKSLPEREIRWILKDDLEGYYSVKGKEGKLYLCDTFGAYGIVDADLDAGYTIRGNTVYYDKQVQYQGRYSVENAKLNISFSYYINDTPTTFLFDAVIAPERMVKTDDRGNLTVGELAQKYMDEKPR